MNRAVFLDRDGVLNAAVVRDGKLVPPASVEEMTLLPGVPAALTRLRAAGFLLVVVTNQPDVARRTARREDVDGINDSLRASLPLDDIQVCFHDDGDGCDCRKPLPGMLLSAAARHGVDLSSSFMVGDRWRDIEAGRRAGCATILIDTGIREATFVPPDVSAASLLDAAQWILSRETK
jgi:D-glycero-D-manno-heptose 1,7-bisphosphate phosphatase